MKSILFAICLLPATAVAIECTIIQYPDRDEVVCIGTPEEVKQAPSSPAITEKKPSLPEQRQQLQEQRRQRNEEIQRNNAARAARNRQEHQGDEGQSASAEDPKPSHEDY